MTYLLSTSLLARSYANAQLAEFPALAPEQNAIVRRRHVYDFKVRASNSMLILTIASIVSSILFHSPAALLLAWVSHQICSSFKSHIENSALWLAFQPLQGEGEPIPAIRQAIAQRQRLIAQEYGFANLNWSPIELQILDWKVWFNPLPPINPQ